jgi:hypothetical protein
MHISDRNFKILNLAMNVGRQRFLNVSKKMHPLLCEKYQANLKGTFVSEKVSLEDLSYVYIFPISWDCYFIVLNSIPELNKIMKAYIWKKKLEELDIKGVMRSDSEYR